MEKEQECEKCGETEFYTLGCKKCIELSKEVNKNE